MPARIETTVERPMKEEALFTPILDIAALERKNAKTEHPTP